MPFCTISLTFEQLNTILTALKFEILKAEQSGNSAALDMLKSAENAIQNFKRV